MSPWWLAGLAAGLLLVHMARPRFERRLLSAARFFKDLPPARQGRPKLRPANPVRSRPLLLHLPLLLLLAAVLHYHDQRLNALPEKGFGVWLLIDTSGSMTVADGARTRLDTAVAEAEALLAQLADEADGREVCVRLSAFDMEVVDLVQTTRPAEVRAALAQLQARPLGTDLELVRGKLATLGAEDDTGCPLTHLVVLSDMPAPDWLEGDTLPVVWRHVGRPMANVGFTGAEALRDPLTGLVRRVRLTVTAYGDLPLEAVTVQVVDPEGSIVLEEEAAWREDQVWRVDFAPKLPGPYRLSLAPGGAWTLDDTLLLTVDDERLVRVDWQLADGHLPRRMGWTQSSENPHLRVLPADTPGDRVPTLLVGPGYAQGRASNEIRDFVEGNPLLEDLNLDAVEAFHLRGMPLPEGFEPILRFTDDQVLAAWRPAPPAVLIPGLPTAGDDSLAHLSAAVFFNALKLLMGARTPAPLYLLTAPGATDTGTYAAIHPGEGHTARAPASYGDTLRLQPVVLEDGGTPLWPLLLTLAVVVFVVERLTAAYGGATWR